MSEKEFAIWMIIAVLTIVLLTKIAFDKSYIVKKIKLYIKSTIIYQKLKLNRIIKRKFKQGYEKVTFNEYKYYPVVVDSIKEKYDIECNYDGLCKVKKKETQRGKNE